MFWRFGTVIHQSGKVKRREERNVLCWLVHIKGSLSERDDSKFQVPGFNRNISKILPSMIAY